MCTVTTREHLLITSSRHRQTGKDSTSIVRCHVWYPCWSVVYFYWSVPNNPGQWFIISSLENTGTYKRASEATTKHIMPALFSVRIPVPELFFDGQSKQCDTAMGGCSHYLCSIKFLWTCQVQTYSFISLFFPPRTKKICVFSIWIQPKSSTLLSFVVEAEGCFLSACERKKEMSQRHKRVIQSNQLYIWPTVTSAIWGQDSFSRGLNLNPYSVRP